jgi:hypothetical protein
MAKDARKHVPTSPPVKHDVNSLFDHESILEWHRPHLLSGERTLSSGDRCIARWNGECLFDKPLEGAYDGIEISLDEGAIRNKQTGDVEAYIHDPMWLPMNVRLAQAGGFKDYVIVEERDGESYFWEEIPRGHKGRDFAFCDVVWKPLAITNCEMFEWPWPRVTFRMIDHSPTAPPAGLIALILYQVANRQSVMG